jgi:hypothetical protein
MEEDREVSLLMTRGSMTLPTTTGIYTGTINAPYVVPPAMLNKKPRGTLFSIRMVPLSRIMPGDLCPHLAMPGMGNKAWVSTR